MIRFWSLSLLAIVFGATLTADAFAQQIRNRRFQTGAGGQPRATSAVPVDASSDRMLAHCLIVDNRGEIEMAQFALQHSQNDDVKNFAQQLIADHSKMLASLESLGRGAQQNQG